MMEHEIGSIVGYCYGINPVTIYDTNIPEGHEFPSMYFPVPISTSAMFTSSAYMKSYSLLIKVFEKDAQSAWAKGEGIADAIRKNRWLVPMIDAQGAPVVRLDGLSQSKNRFVKIKNVNTRIIDHGEDGKMAIAQLTIEWDSVYNFNFETYQKMMQINFRQG